MVLAAKVHRPKLADLPPHKITLLALDAEAVWVGVVDRDAEFSLEIFLVTIQATINLNTDHTKGVTRIHAKNNIY
ncbi:MAG: hypothetical protein AVO38_08360 [delta proteobacterium ML8_D]|nr:MAG: hypothetical protein AVO38_08360 [delta proteobacterium ML8_D]